MSKTHEIAEKIKQQLAEWEVDIDRLESKIEQAQGEAKIKLDDTVSDLKEKRDELKQKFDKFEDAAEEAVEDLIEGVELAWESLKLGFLSARSEFMDKETDKE